MKAGYIVLLLMCVCMSAAAQTVHSGHHNHVHPEDSADVFYEHLKLNEVVVTGVTGETRLKYATVPVNVVSARELRQTVSTNLIDAVARQPGMAQITTGGGDIHHCGQSSEYGLPKPSEPS